MKRLKELGSGAWEIMLKYSLRAVIALLLLYLVYMFYGLYWAYSDEADRVTGLVDSNQITLQTADYMMSIFAHKVYIEGAGIIALVLFLSAVLIMVHISLVKNEVYKMDLRLWDISRTVREMHYTRMSQSLRYRLDSLESDASEGEEPADFLEDDEDKEGEAEENGARHTIHTKE